MSTKSWSRCSSGDLGCSMLLAWEMASRALQGVDGETQGWWELNLVLFIWLRDWPHVRLRSPGIEIMSFRSEVRSYTITVKRLSLFLRHPYLSVHSLTLGNYSPTSLPWDCRKASKKTLSITFIKSSNGSSEYTREKWLLSISENYQEAFLGHFIHAEC